MILPIMLSVLIGILLSRLTIPWEVRKAVGLNQIKTLNATLESCSAKDLHDRWVEGMRITATLLKEKYPEASEAVEQMAVNSDNYAAIAYKQD